MPLLDDFQNGLGNIYGQGGPGDPLIALGMGLLSQRGLARGMAAGMQNMGAMAQLAHQRQQEEARSKLLAAQTARALQPTYHTDPNTGIVSAIDPEKGLVPLPGQTQTQAWHWAQPNELPTDYKGPPVAVGKNGPIYPPASTTINTTPGPSGKVFEEMSKRADEARTVAQSIPMFGQARQLLDAGAITGPGADLRLTMHKVGAMFGLDPAAAENTETFRSTVAPIVLGMVKGLGAGSGISNADREFAEKAAGGNINLEAGSIRRLMDIGERAANYKLKAYQSTYNAVYPDTQDNAQVRALFGVQPPELTPQSASPPSGVGAPASPQQHIPSAPAQETPKAATPSPSSVKPAANAKPPMEGARQAQDGKWYVQKLGKWYRID